MATVTFKENQTQISGQPPRPGQEAPAFQLVAQDLSELSLESFEGKRKILNVFPSLDTGTCAQSVRKFYLKCHEIEDLVVLNISMDLPFAASRFCEAERMDQAISLSAFRSSFPEEYGLRISEGPLKGLCARAVFVLDARNTILYTELVPEITHEPNYEAALAALST